MIHKKVNDNPQLRHDPNNAKIHTERNKSVIDASLKEIGAFRSIAVDGDGIIRAGNGVYEQALAQGKKIKIVDTDADTLIAVRRKDLTGEQAIKAALYDNRAGELGEWNVDVLKEISLEFSPAFFEGVFEPVELTFGDTFDFGDSPETVEQNMAELSEIRNSRKLGNEGVQKKTDSERYLTIVFPDRDTKENFCASMGLPKEERYLASSQVSLKLNLKINKNFDAISQPSKSSGTTGGVCRERQKRTKP